MKFGNRFGSAELASTFLPSLPNCVDLLDNIRTSCINFNFSYAFCASTCCSALVFLASVTCAFKGRFGVTSFEVCFLDTTFGFELYSFS